MEQEMTLRELITLINDTKAEILIHVNFEEEATDGKEIRSEK